MNFECNGPALSSEMQGLSDSIKNLLPPAYVAFIDRCNGGEGFVGENYLMLWRVNELDQFNSDYEVGEYLTDVVLFGSNGGGEAYGFRVSPSVTQVIRVPFVGMCDDLCIVVCDSFSDFVSTLERL